MLIDTTFDFRTDARNKDPDQHSPTLRRYHRFLWSKQLSNGRQFTLNEGPRGKYLHHQSDLGEFSLASDGIVQTFTLWKRPQVRRLLDQFPEEEHRAFQTAGYTIGGFLVFPGNMIDGRQTINALRGYSFAIRDRIDLTLESIRRHYLGETSPLAEPLSRYRDFFALFEDFRGYVDFFLLNDLVSNDRDRVETFLPLDLAADGLPRDANEYREYRRRMIEFVQARNRRIEAYAFQFADPAT